MRANLVNNWRVPLVEFLGTFVFVLISLGAVLTNNLFADIGIVGVALASGAAVAAMVAATAPVSGGHLNPAVTLALWLVHKIDGSLAIFYIVAQVLASLAAAGVLVFVFGQRALDFNLGAQVLGVGISQQAAVALEAILTATWVFVFLATMGKGESLSFRAVGIGLVVVAATLVAGPLSGGVLNPAKVIGAAVVSQSYNGLLVWIVGPLAGSLLAIVYDFVFLRKRKK